jgi:hypothetical protein
MKEYAPPSEKWFCGQYNPLSLNHSPGLDKPTVSEPLPRLRQTVSISGIKPRVSDVFPSHGSRLPYTISVGFFNLLLIVLLYPITELISVFLS